jgi:hypothetical protein
MLYAIVESDNLPSGIICPGSKYRGVIMNKGLKVNFELAFTAKGPVAENIKCNNEESNGDI